MQETNPLNRLGWTGCTQQKADQTVTWIKN